MEIEGSSRAALQDDVGGPVGSNPGIGPVDRPLASPCRAIHGHLDGPIAPVPQGRFHTFKSTISHASRVAKSTFVPIPVLPWRAVSRQANCGRGHRRVGPPLWAIRPAALVRLLGAEWLRGGPSPGTRESR